MTEFTYEVKETDDRVYEVKVNKVVEVPEQNYFKVKDRNEAQPISRVKE